MSRKDIELRIRVEHKLRKEFPAVRRAQGRPATQVVRDFMQPDISEYRMASSSRRLPADSVNENP